MDLKLGPTSTTFLVSALTMPGGQAIGARALIEGTMRVTDLLGSETAAPAIDAVNIRLTAYFVWLKYRRTVLVAKKYIRAFPSTGAYPGNPSESTSQSLIRRVEGCFQTLYISRNPQVGSTQLALHTSFVQRL